jgi:peptide/nickel transport system substrate-binding protein
MRTSRVRRRGSAVVAGLLALGLVAAACGGDDSDTSPAGTGSTGTGSTGGATTTTAAAKPVAGGSATVQLFSEIATLDPVKATGSGGSDGQRFFALYGALMTYDGNTQKMDYLLAESFKPDATNKIWTMKLKPGNKFIDGTDFNAEAVKANYERCQVAANASPARGVCALFTKLEVPDPLTLVITNAQANAHLDKAISRFNLNYIASKKAIDDKTDLTQKAIGAGPFKQDEWVRDSRLVMSKNPDWKATPVYLDKLTFQVQGNEQQRIDSFGTGATDAFYTAVPGSIEAATKSVKESYVTKVELTTGNTFVMNNTKAPFDDARIRRAIITAIPRDVLATDILNKSIPAQYFSVPGTPFHSEGSKLPAYDVAAAQKLIDAYVAEKGGPVKFTMLAFQQTLDQDRAKFIVAQLGKLKNLQVDFVVNDSPTNIGKVLAGDYQWSSWGFPVVEPEPGLFNQARSGVPTNYARYSNPEVDKWLDEARASTDNTLRNANYKKVMDQLAKDLPYFPYIVNQNSFVCSPKLQGCALYEDGILRVDKLWKKA